MVLDKAVRMAETWNTPMRSFFKAGRPGFDVQPLSLR